MSSPSTRIDTGIIVGGPVSTVRTSIRAPAIRVAERFLERSDEWSGVFAATELEEELRVVRRGRLRAHGEPEPRSAGADKGRDGRQ